MVSRMQEKMVNPEGENSVDKTREVRNTRFLGNEKHSGGLQYTGDRVPGSY